MPEINCHHSRPIQRRLPKLTFAQTCWMKMISCAMPCSMYRDQRERPPWVIEPYTITLETFLLNLSFVRVA